MIFVIGLICRYVFHNPSFFFQVIASRQLNKRGCLAASPIVYARSLSLHVPFIICLNHRNLLFYGRTLPHSSPACAFKNTSQKKRDLGKRCEARAGLNRCGRNFKKHLQDRRPVMKGIRFANRQRDYGARILTD